jgi:hypothetical protein
MDAKDSAIAKLVELLNRDIEFFEKMANALEQLLPIINDPEKRQWAEREVKFRREKAEELRTLIKRVESEQRK